MIQTHPEPHSENSTDKLNAMRASVLGANDGIVSVAAIVVGVAGATQVRSSIFIAGLAGLVAGTMSMAAGEYVSVSSQKDSERSLLNKEKAELRDYPAEELDELIKMYQSKGLTKKTAKQVSVELTKHDALAAHAELELGINPDRLQKLSNPLQAAVASAISFICGGWVPLLTIIAIPARWRIPATFVAVLAALCVTGYLSARVGDANKIKAIIRVLIGGSIAMIVTYTIGKLVGMSVA